MLYMSDIDIEHLSKLARIQPPQGEKKEKLTQDLQHIVEYFSQLQSCDTEGVEPLYGNSEKIDGSREDSDILRDDSVREEEREKSISQFPEKENAYLKVPPVFDR